MPEMPKSEPTHYDRLMVARNASLDVIRAAYRALTQKYHPDRNNDHAAATRVMQVINESYGVLCDPKKRAEYDRQLAKEERERELEARRGLVPISQGGKITLPVLQEAPRTSRRRSPIVTLTFAIALVLMVGLEVFRFRYPELARSTFAPLAARVSVAVQPRPPAVPEERRVLQAGAIERPAADPAPASSSPPVSDSAAPAGTASSSDSAGSAEPASASSASADPAPVEDAPSVVAAAPAKPAPKKPRARPAKRVAQRTRTPPPPVADSAPVAPAPAVPDELAEVRAKDPAAADRIASYCITVAKTAVDGGTACRRNETLAWKNFVFTSNHAQIYEEVRIRCSPAVYPDSYEAKEACVRHEAGFQPRSQ